MFLFENFGENINFVIFDKIYDYFEIFFRKEIYLDNLFYIYIFIKKVLEKIKCNNLEERIIKIFVLIYIFE